MTTINLITIIMTIFIIIILYIFFWYIQDKINNKLKKSKYAIQKGIEDIDWRIYQYKFLKKLTYIEKFYNKKYNEKNEFVSELISKINLEENRNISFYDFYISDICRRFEEIIVENQEIFDTIYIEDKYIESCKILKNKSEEVLSEINKIIK